MGGGKGGYGAWSPMFGKGGKDGGKGSISEIVKGLCMANALPGTDGYSNDDMALYIAGLPPDTTDLDLYKIFGSFGAIPPKGVRAMVGDDGMCRGFGFVNYMEAGALEAAMMTLNGTTLPNGKTLTVKPKGPGGQGKGKGEGKE